jgi:hypothetical protein
VTRPASRRAWTAWAAGTVTLAALLAAPGPVQAGETPAEPPTETPTAPAEEPEDDGEATEEDIEPPADPLRVVIDRLAPSVVPQRGTVRVTGTVLNRSDASWRNLNVYLLRATEPITDEETLTSAAEGSCVAVGERVIDPFEEVPDLEPGRSARFRLTVPVRALGLSGAAGVYPVGIHVLGEDSTGRDGEADGRACTFLPLVPEGTATTLALGIQVRRPTVRSADGTLRFPAGWDRMFGDGRLRRLLDLGVSAVGRPLTWVLDPALLDTAQSVARGNPPVRLAPPPDDATGPAPDGAGEPGEDAGGEEEAEDPEPATPEQTAALDWLTDLVAELASSPVMALPYGDLDAAASVNQGVPDLLTTAQVASAGVLETWDVSSTPALVPPSGLLPDALLSQVGPETTAVVERSALPPAVTGPVLERTDGGRLVVVQPGATVWGPGPGPRRSALAVRQRLLADAALHALSDAGDEPLVRLLPAWWDPGPDWRRAGFFRGLDVGWLAPGGLGQAVSAPVGGRQERVRPEALVYPEEEADRELPFFTLAAARDLGEAGRSLGQLLTDNDAIDATLTRQGLLSASVWSRARPRVAAARARGAEEIADGWLSRVSVRGPSFVTMSGDQGTFDVTVVNGLDQPVTVGLEASALNTSLSLSTPDPVELPPRGRGPMRIDATATDIGIHLVTLQPVTTEGVPVGESSTLSIRSSRVGLILWIVMGVAGSLLFVLVAFRIVRRVRQRRRTHGPLLQARQP